MMSEQKAQKLRETAASEELNAKMKAQIGDFFDVDSHGDLTLKPIGNIPPFKMIYVKGGEFTMGDEQESDNEPHKVLLNTFFMAEYPVTQELYLAVTGKSPSLFQGINHPVEQINWFDAIDFCNILNSKIGFSRICNKDYEPVDSNGRNSDDMIRINGFRLPTEAEWEFAARVGEKPDVEQRLLNEIEAGSHACFLYEGSNNIDNVGWYFFNNRVETRPVGVKFPNALGIYDICGNIWEWCWDWYGYISFSKEILITNPVNLKRGSFRVLRGGSWYSDNDDCRFVNRYGNLPDDKWNRNGFRLLFAFQFT